MSLPRSIRVVATALVVLASTRAVGARGDVSTLPPPAERAIDFGRDVQPLLERACLKCHGPEKQKGGYRVDTKSAALTGGDNFAPNIVPGKSAESPLIHFVGGLDPDMKMPAKGDPLTTSEIAILRAWIDQGAAWPGSETEPEKDPLDWWSLRALNKPPVPKQTQFGGAKSELGNPIDAFIRAKLAENGLAPSPPADARTLIRRVYFDLTGLPPTPEEVEAFIAASAHDANTAYRAVVERLLASPRYGERWARHWLDVVHYGDTHGYDKDKPRENAWPYRDYVIRALNADKPYARFVQEQIAGDALFPGTEDGITALGFIAAGPWDLIGHAEVPETKTDGKIARLLDRDDMVANTMNTFCATTVQCARCHNHKFDPVKQEDYYRLQAVFAAVDRADKTYFPDPATGKRHAALERQKRELRERKQQFERTAEQRAVAGLKELDAQIEKLAREPKGAAAAEFGYHSAIAAAEDAMKWVQVDLGQSRPIAQVVLAPCHDDFNSIGAGFGFPRRFRVDVSDDPEFRGFITIGESMAADLPNPGISRVSYSASGTSARYVRVTATKLAPRKGDYIFALAELEVLDANGRNVASGAAVTALDSIEAPPRWRKANLTDGRFPANSSAPTDALAAASKRRRELLLAALEEPARVELERVEQSLAGVAAELAKLPPPKRVYAGTVHRGEGAFAGTGANGGKPRPIFVLSRGDVRQPGKEVGPGTLPVLPGAESSFHLPPDCDESARRAALAEWITDHRNPLTWRVIVNRVWQWHFGRGLVDSPNDFGRMGQQPSHPELLDWLACDFRDNGGSLKDLHRLILTSASYRQASSVSPTADDCCDESAPASPQLLDADNRLLWRMNRRKLEAEAVRDAMLSVAGKLDLSMGGPGYRDFAIEKAEHSPQYVYRAHDADDPHTHRRSIYRFIVRSQPQPFMSALDCADPSISVDKRNETINALQALAWRNNKVTVAMGRHFAARIADVAKTTEEQITSAVRLALQRNPTADEHATLTAYAREHGLPNACRVILNLNEFAFVD